MKLYFSPGACSLAPHIILQESGLSFEAIPVNLRTKIYSGGDFRQINPKGSVPVLEIGNGKILTEAAVILQYVSDQKPDARLMPAIGTWERYQCQEWLNYISTELHKGFAPLWNPLTPDAYKEIALKNLSARFEFVNTHLTTNDFLMGSQFTVTDAYLFTVLNWANMLKIDLSPWTAIQKFMEIIKSRPATVAAIEREKQSKEKI